MAHEWPLNIRTRQFNAPSRPVDKARGFCVVGQFGSAVKGHDFSRAAKAPK
jgi:hypothetical protein